MDTLERAFTLLLPYWPFIATIAIFGLVGTVANKRIFTDAQARVKRSTQPFWWWARKTLPLHPALSGVALGFLWKLPSPGVDTTVERCAYFAFAGAIAVFAYEVVKGLAKKRGILLDLPGESKANGEAPKPPEMPKPQEAPKP